jgi:hypothetical protein
MPRFRIHLEGSDIAIPGDVAGAPQATIRGFFTTRILEAPTQQEAAVRASTQVAEEWSAGEFARYKATPTIAVSEARPLRFWELMRARNAGYVFHPGCSESE